jgi:fermentation-respiration switch protein FrsA (DUF1100 family)
LLVVLVLTAILYLGGGMVFANMIHSDALVPLPPTPDYGVYALEAGEGTITLTSAEERDDTIRPGVAGLAWEGGYGRVGQIIDQDGLTVIREFTVVDGTQPPLCPGALDECDPVDMEGWAFQNDPSDVGLAFDEVTYQSDLGEMGSWVIPAGDGSIWAIHAHGWRAERREALRSLPTFHQSGITSMVIDYRNDVGAPNDPSGLYRFGRSEWADVEAAVHYATEQGAETVTLVGYSTGAAIQMAFLENSEMAGAVGMVVFDSPNVDMAESVRTEAARRTIPGTPIPVPPGVTGAALAIADLRWDVGWGEIDYVDRAGSILDRPTLVFHGVADDRVPIEVARRLQEQAPEVVELVEVEEAGHVTSWNVDPTGYEETLARFLDRHAGA